MTTFLETLKSRLEDAQKRYQEITAKLQALQQQHQTLNQEVFGWQQAVQAETNREQQATVTTTPASESPATHTVGSRTVVSFETQATDGGETNNKTEAIRELLRQHPTGMTPAQIWNVMKGQIPHRPYVYSVLKRLKDRKQITERRGKYFLQVISKPEEVQAVLQ
jgi:hypothetical protein